MGLESQSFRSPPWKFSIAKPPINSFQTDLSRFSFFKFKPLCHHRFFFQKCLHLKPQKCVGEQEREVLFCNWPFKIVIVREFQNVSWNCFHSIHERIFFVSTDGILSLSERYLKRKLYIYSVGWVWKNKINDTCIDNSTLGNVQYMHFRLIYFVSKNWISPSQKAGLFATRSSSETSVLCWRKRKKKQSL